MTPLRFGKALVFSLNCMSYITFAGSQFPRCGESVIRKQFHEKENSVKMKGNALKNLRKETSLFVILVMTFAGCGKGSSGYEKLTLTEAILCMKKITRLVWARARFGRRAPCQKGAV
jgi:hypothetical protein